MALLAWWLVGTYDMAIGRTGDALRDRNDALGGLWDTARCTYARRSPARVCSRASGFRAQGGIYVGPPMPRLLSWVNR